MQCTSVRRGTGPPQEASQTQRKSRFNVSITLFLFSYSNSCKNLGHFTIKLAETTTIYLLQTFLLEISTLAAFWNPVINIKYSVKIHEMFHCQNFLFSAFHLFIHSNKHKALAFKLYDYFFYQKRCHLPKSFS